ncbi:MAG: hypothetical protein QWI36_02780 [Wolbachia endosymbiont of Tyrophagus putrescentiae]|nr:hypothetical protein [Wolbachia endosymbiont of Tyrophagus putrescentiae]
MSGCCNGNGTQKSPPQYVEHIKSSIFCGTKGFLTCILAFSSWSYYSTFDKSNRHINLKNQAEYATKENIIPFLEMTIIVPFVCFGLPTTGLVQCALICAALMITTCFFVRHFQLRGRLLKYIISFSEEEIKKISEALEKDTLPYLIREPSNSSYLAILLVFPLKVLQSCILLSLAVVELLEAIPSFCVDIFYDRSFESTKSNVQKSGHLLYASARNVLPLSRFDNVVADFIGTPKSTCCGT